MTTNVIISTDEDFDNIIAEYETAGAVPKKGDTIFLRGLEENDNKYWVVTEAAWDIEVHKYVENMAEIDLFLVVQLTKDEEEKKPDDHSMIDYGFSGDA